MSSDEDEDREEGGDVVDSEQADAGAEAAPVREETPELPSSESRRKLREQLEAEMQAFLKRGGRIEVVEASAGTQTTSFTAGVNDLSQ